MEKAALKETLRLHALYVSGQLAGKRANLAGANLSEANLAGVNLIRDNLTGANLTGANLTGANLIRANLTGANLTGANLTGANLIRANLTGANLIRANLAGANLSGANLAGVNFTGANLAGVNFTGANLTGAKLPRFQIPQEGELIVFKKLANGMVVKLRVPANARRTATPIGRKCRAEFVEVVEGSGMSQHDRTTPYDKGKIVRPDSYDDDIRVECTNGIHFFLTREEAEEY